MKLKSQHKVLKFISAALFLVAVLSVFQEKLDITIDNTTLLIIALAIVVYILPYLTKIQYKDLTIDLENEVEKQVDQLEKLVIVEEVSTKPALDRIESKNVDWKQYYLEYKQILDSKVSNLEKILRASQLVELMITVAGQDFGLSDGQKNNSSVIIRELYKNSLINKEELDLYNEFYSLRNKIIHGELKEISDALTTRILDLLWRIVRIFG